MRRKKNDWNFPFPADHILHAWADMMYQRYESPIYLVGSALYKKEPRDIDVVCVMTDEKFASRYGLVSEWIQRGLSGTLDDNRKKWSDETMHQTRLSWKFTKLTIDFKIIPITYDQQYTEPKFRLDSIEILAN